LIFAVLPLLRRRAQATRLDAGQSEHYHLPLQELGQGVEILFMVLERFKNRDAKAIYRRLNDKGRMVPEGLNSVGSWIEANFDRCFQKFVLDAPLFNRQSLQAQTQFIMYWGRLRQADIYFVLSSNFLKARAFQLQRDR
jgi:hypothetical protein